MTLAAERLRGIARSLLDGLAPAAGEGDERG
jgi:hypothetical protein